MPNFTDVAGISRFEVRISRVGGFEKPCIFGVAGGVLVIYYYFIISKNIYSVTKKGFEV